jgi:HD-GYP domain-containing protein (c-di-GMP phosphodiesterase class II)
VAPSFLAAVDSNGPPELPAVEPRLRTLLDDLDRRDGFAPGHSTSVCTLAVRIGRALGLDDEALSHLALGALLHDIGKLFIDARVLAKPTSLSETEWTAIRLHPVLGEALLGRDEHEAGILGVVRWHHERWDGDGYPDGLSGQSIPIGARIVAAADAFTAMCEPRPYRRAVVSDEAVEELERTSWTHFDGGCVRALVESLSVTRRSSGRRRSSPSVRRTA